ncbi:thymidine kinase [Longimonas halophila]|uniref:Thymidine kinase n=1 Tax=Longimonas halophila TaxID=1469170 RepID=A0A2H3NIQ9_9BACT|nr:thymidine kinase [Longimonas halophila]PEN05248.1 thymidine kinase [Longimonas halophila]
MEPHIVDRTRNAGWIEVVCGSMFSGKTEELIRRLRRARIARQETIAFKPALDTRYSDDEVVSHDETALPTVPVESAASMIRQADGADVVGIDEAQFFGNDLVEACQTLAARGVRVVVAGLDQDYKGQPFEPIPQLMAIAEHVTKLHAICVQCGAPANHSQRIVPGDERVLLGATEAYEPRCRDCFQPGEVPESTAPAPAAPVTSSASPEGGE